MVLSRNGEKSPNKLLSSVGSSVRRTEPQLKSLCNNPVIRDPSNSFWLTFADRQTHPNALPSESEGSNLPTVVDLCNGLLYVHHIDSLPLIQFGKRMFGFFLVYNRKKTHKRGINLDE